MAEEREVERLFTVNLRSSLKAPRTRRAPMAMKVLRAHIARHMNAEPSKVLIDDTINALIWKRGIQRPPARITVRAVWFPESEEVAVSLPKV